MIIILYFIFLLKTGSAVIFSVNDTEYNKMPILYALDDYDLCMLDPEGTYCVIDAELFSTTNSSLLSFISAYSQHKNKHFNHTQLHRGICVTQTCQNLLNKTESLEQTLEECLNESIWRDYKLETRLSRIRYCKRSNEIISYDGADCVVAAIYMLIILLNLIASFYDCWQSRIGNKGNPYLQAFSIRRNWISLRASDNGESERFRVLQGVRTLMVMCFVVSHVVFAIFHLYVDNPHSLEKSYNNPFNYIMLNGMVVTAIFFVMSNFLLAYNFEVSTEKTGVQWSHIPTGIILRWLRLTPAYALILATVATWMRHLGSGPQWDQIVTIESDSCREYWWMHMLYINNFFYRNDKCLIHTWYLAADTQLFCIGLVICVVARTPRHRKIILTALFVISVIIVAALTYFLGLDGTVLQYPETFRDLYASNETFLQVYLLPHTNLSSCAIGLAGGFLTYHWQRTRKDFTKFKKYGWLVWLILPICTLLLMLGAMFSIDGSPPSTALKVAYAAFSKPLFQILMVILIVSCIFKIDNAVRSVMEWKGFSWTGNLTYTVFLVHICVLRALLGSGTRPLHFNLTTALLFINATVFMSYACAAILFVLVEAPTNNLMKALLKPRMKSECEDKTAEVQRTGTEGNGPSPSP